MTRGPRRHIEKALGAMTRSTDPVEVLDAARQLREAAEQVEWSCARDARAAGVTWARIGVLYGTSKQAVQQRFGRLPGPRSTRPQAEPAPQE